MKYNINKLFLLLLISTVILSSCVAKKKYLSLEMQLELKQDELYKANAQLDDCNDKLRREKQDVITEKGNVEKSNLELQGRDRQIETLRDQINDLRNQRDQQMQQVGDLALLSKEANDNITATIRQLETKDKYIRIIQTARSKTDSMSLALAINLKSQLSQGIADQDIRVSVDKTVVYINLSDKLLFASGSSKVNLEAKDVIFKISQVINARPDLEVMVEGFTDTNPIKNTCMIDNWDLSVKRATSVIRILEQDYNVDPNRLIAAGRGQYNSVATNETTEGRQMNRRTRIVLLPKLDQFYDLLNPTNVPN